MVGGFILAKHGIGLEGMTLKTAGLNLHGLRVIFIGRVSYVG